MAILNLLIKFIVILAHINPSYTRLSFIAWHLTPFSDSIGGCIGGVAKKAVLRIADRTDTTFPFEITYTEQKSGADFVNIVGLS